MALLNYKKGKTVSFQGKGEKAKPVSLAQYLCTMPTGQSEPTILKTGRYLDAAMRERRRRKSQGVL